MRTVRSKVKADSVKINMRSYTKTIYVSILMALAFPGLRAQHSNIRFEVISVDQGLSQSSVSAIMQDRIGFMWFGTQDGLNKYDGINFKIYQHDPLDSNSISLGAISCIFEDRHGEIWIAFGETGLDRFDPQREVFRHYDRKLAAQVPSVFNSVKDILEDGAGTLWFATTHGLARLDRTSDSFTYFTVDSTSSKSNRIDVLFEDSHDVLWVGAVGEVYQFDRKIAAFKGVALRTEEGKVPDVEAITAIFEDSGDTMWFGTILGGLWQYDREHGTINVHRSRLGDEFSLSANSISAIVEDTQGVLWVGTYQGGLNRLTRNEHGVRFNQFTHDRLAAGSLSSNRILSAAVDRSGTIWIGTSGGGISKYDPDKIKFQHYANDRRHPEALRGNLVWALYEDSHGMLWIGVEGGGLNTLDRNTGKFRVYQHDAHNPASISSNTVMAICEDAAGTLWVGTRAGLNLFNRETGTFSLYLHEPDSSTGMMVDPVRALYADPDGSLWFSSRGLNKLEPETGELIRFTNEPGNPKSLSSNGIQAIVGDERGYLWIATAKGGLNRFDKKTATFTRFMHDPENPNSISMNYVLSLCQASSGALWVGTFNGLNRFDPGTGEFRVFTTRNGLPNNVIYGVLCDAAGNLWASSNRGLTRLNPITGEVKNYTIDDGLQSSEFNGGAYFKSKSGEMFFGGVNGFNAFHPDSVRDNPYIPPVVITTVKRFDERIRPPGDGASPVEFSYKDDFVSFEFAALDYTNPEKNQYAYRLEGLREDWIYCGNQRYATFTNLKPGRYVFRVKGSNNDGIWNEAGAALEFIVTPPFWQTWWFRWLSVAIGLTSFLLFFRFLSAKQKAKAELDRKFAELKLQALRAQMNPHFIFNTINSIQYYISSNEQKAAHQYLSKFAKLMRMTLDNSEKSMLTVQDELDALKLYLELESLRFEGKFTYELDVDPKIDVHNTEIPALLIQPFVENAIQHGLRFKRTKGALSIQLKAADRAIICLIEDNGIGIEKALELKSKQNGQHKSAGMKVTRERLETLNALKRNGRSIEIIDLSKRKGNTQGTRVKIVIPVEG